MANHNMIDFTSTRHRSWAPRSLSGSGVRLSRDLFPWDPFDSAAIAARTPSEDACDTTLHSRITILVSDAREAPVQCPTGSRGVRQSDNWEPAQRTIRTVTVTRPVEHGSFDSSLRWVARFRRFSFKGFFRNVMLIAKYLSKALDG